MKASITFNHLTGRWEIWERATLHTKPRAESPNFKDLAALCNRLDIRWESTGRHCEAGHLAYDPDNKFCVAKVDDGYCELPIHPAPRKKPVFYEIEETDGCHD